MKTDRELQSMHSKSGTNAHGRSRGNLGTFKRLIRCAVSGASRTFYSMEKNRMSFINAMEKQ